MSWESVLPGFVPIVIALALPAAESTADGTLRTCHDESFASKPFTAPLELAPKPADFSRALFTETNRVRRAYGRSALQRRRELEAAADDQAAFMALTMQVRHDSFLRGQATPADRVRRHGVGGRFIAENVASTSLNAPPQRDSATATAAALVELWLNSPGHRENLLNPQLTHFGGAIRLSRLAGQWNAYGVQVFLVEGSGL